MQTKCHTGVSEPPHSSRRHFRWRTLGFTCLACCSLVSSAAAGILVGPVRNPANGHDYYLLTTSGWGASEAEARALGGHLVTLNNAAEQSWVYATFGNYGGVPRHLWLGLYDVNHHANSSDRLTRMNEFAWISGETPTYRNWSPFEPSNSGGVEECVHIWAPTDPYAGFWNDLDPNATSLFGAGLHGVVEVSHIPPPRGDVVVNPTVAPDVFYRSGSTRKIEQLVGDFDRERNLPTQNVTDTRYQLWGTDLGIPFRHRGDLWLLFGDTIGPVGGDRDTLARTSDNNLEDGLRLNFLSAGGTYRPITIPGITQASFEVPSEGVSVNDLMYVYHTTDNSSVVPMGRSVLAVSADDGATFRLLYTLSQKQFINVSVVTEPVARWHGVPAATGDGLFLFGSGSYRQSNVRLAFQPADRIEERSAIRYFTGLDACRVPTWSSEESDAISLFQQPCVGEFSVTYNPLLRRWLMCYNCDAPRGINFRTARFPWGPWSEPGILFEPWDDGGYCHFMHTSWAFRNCDAVHDPGRQDDWGGEYGPYLFKDIYSGSASRVTFYFTMSTWNPYTVVLMKTELQKPSESAPRLKTSLAGHSLRLSWPCPDSGYRLLTAFTLDAPQPWHELAVQPALVGGQWTLEVPVSGTRQFFRLDLP